MLKRLKTLPLTIVLTILIWMYAEAQFTSPRDNGWMAPRDGVSLVVPEVPVWVAGSPEVMGKFDVELRTKVVRVVVSGSEGSIGALRQRMGLVGSGGVVVDGVQAYLDILPGDKAGEGFLARRLRYVLPEGLVLQESVVEGEFRLVEKGAATRGR